MGIENKISDERLKELAGDFIMNGFANVGECTEIARELLSLRAQLAELAKQEPVAVKYAKGDVLTREECADDIVFAICCKVETPLFNRAAPPAPVKFPEWTDQQCLEFISIAFRHAEISGDIKMDDIRLAMKIITAGVEVADE